MATDTVLIYSKIINYLKEKKGKENKLIFLDDILEEVNESYVPSSVKEILINYLKYNSKIEFRCIFEKYMFKFKPYYEINQNSKKDMKKSLVKIVKDHQESGNGGILLDNLNESLYNYDEFFKLNNDLNDFIIINGQDKKKIVFYNDLNFNMEIDPIFVKIWRENNFIPKIS